MVCAIEQLGRSYSMLSPSTCLQFYLYPAGSTIYNPHNHPHNCPHQSAEGRTSRAPTRRSYSGHPLQSGSVFAQLVASDEAGDEPISLHR